MCNTGHSFKRVTLRFLLSPKGAGYMYPSWWIRREHNGWMSIPPEDTHYHNREFVDTTGSIQPGELIRIASAPYEEPEASP